MAKVTTHTQCSLARGETHEVAWIPSDKAVVGKYVKLQTPDGTWTDGWEVLTVGLRMPSEMVLERQRDFTSQRSASDI